MSDTGGKPAPTPEQRKVIALLPIGMSLVSIGVVLSVVFERPMVNTVGFVLLGAGAAILLIMIVQLQRLKREGRS